MLSHISHFGALPDGDGPERRIEWSDYRGWAALRLKQGVLELIVVPSIGGRLMNIVHDDVELCFVNDTLAGLTLSEDPRHWRSLCGKWGFPLWGGGKTWVAPESRWPGGAPHRDLDSGPYRVARTWCNETTMGVDMLSAVCRQSGLQIRRRIELDSSSGTWRTCHELTNLGTSTIECGIWDVLMLRRPGVVSVAMEGEPADWRDQIISFVDKGPLGDIRNTDVVSLEADSLSVRCARPLEFKLGITTANGALDALLTLPQGSRRYQRRLTVQADVEYAHGAPVEIFNAPELQYFEIESHGALTRLAPKSSCSLTVEDGVCVA